MNTKVVGSIVAVIIVLGGGYLLLAHKSPTSQGDSATMQTAQPASLKQLLASGVSQQCSFTDATSSSSGTVYVAQGSMRGDFTSTANSKTIGTHMISDGTTMYLWIDGMPSGFKMSMTATTSTSSSAQGFNQSFDANKTLDYQCTAWSDDTSVFTLPAGVTFNEVNTMMSGSASAGAGMKAGTTMPGMPQSACSQCDSVPAAYQAQCRAAAHC